MQRTALKEWDQHRAQTGLSFSQVRGGSFIEQGWERRWLGLGGYRRLGLCYHQSDLIWLLVI